MRANFNSRLIFSILLFVAFIFPFSFLVWSTPLGIGVSPDSVTYIDTARNLLSGKGLQSGDMPLTHFPPVYPIVLAVSGLWGSDPLPGARWLHATLFGLNALLIGVITFWSTTKSVVGSLISILFFISSAQMFDLHTWAWSEPAFLFLCFSAFLLIALYISRPGKWLLLGASLFAGAAITTRYIGLALILAIMAIILLFGAKRFRDRITDSLILLLVAILPSAIWFLRNILVTQSAIDRTLAIHPIHFTHIESLVTTLYNFWIPIPCSDCSVISLILFLFAGSLVLVGYLFVMRNELRGKASIEFVIQTLMLLFSISYVLFLFASISFADAQIPLDSRILSPVYISGVIFVISVFRKTADRLSKDGIWRGFLVLSLLLIGINWGSTISSANYLRDKGKGYTSLAWRNSESIAFIKTLPEDSIIYSNGPDAIRFLAQRETKLLPLRVDPGTQAPNPDFVAELETMGDDLIQNRAWIFYLDRLAWRSYFLAKDELKNIQDFNRLAEMRLQDGTVYTIDHRPLTTDR
jgi:4-amino-4-deoxy-L-arabinose transferase-like glycosyltransferase